MEERKKEIEAHIQGHEEVVNKILNTFGAENRGQAITQWNMKALIDVLGQAFFEFRVGLLTIADKYEEDIRRLSDATEDNLHQS